MKYLVYLIVLAVLILLPISSACAPTVAPTQKQTKQQLPEVSIKYPGDTDQTIIRRAQWIENAKKEGALGWWGIISAELAYTVVAEFNKIYPFVKVDYWYATPGELATKLEGEFTAGRISTDISQGGNEYNHPRWREMGLMEKFNDIIPDKEKMDKRMYSMYGDWIQIGQNLNVPIYNTKLVSASEAPKSWEDLLDPKWKGRQIGVQPMMGPFNTLALGEGGWGVEKTEEFLTKLKQQELVYTQGYSNGLSLLIAGEFKIMATNLVWMVLQAQEKAAPVQWTKISPAMILGPYIILRKGSPHPNAAKLFLEWISSPQGLQTYDRITWQGVAFPGSGTRQAKIAEAEGMKLIIRTEEASIKAANLLLDDRFGKALGIAK